MQEVWVFTTQGLNPKPVPKEKWERRFLNLSEAPSLHHFVRCRFWKKSQDDGGSEVIYFDRSIHSSRDPEKQNKGKQNNPPVTSFSYQTQSHQQSLLLLLVIYAWLIPAPSKLRKSTNCKNHCRALS